MLAWDVLPLVFWHCPAQPQGPGQDGRMRMGAHSPGRLDWLWQWVPSTGDNLCCSACVTPLPELPCPFLALSRVTDRHQHPSGDSPNELVPCPQGTV